VRLAAVRKLLWAGIIVLSALILIEWVKFDVLREPVARRLSAALGTEVRLLGHLHLDLGLKPDLEAEHVTVAGLAGVPELATIGRLELKFDLWRLLWGRLEIDELRLADVELLLESDPEGRHVLPIPRGRGDTSTTSDGIQVQLDAARLENLSIRYRNASSGTAWRTAVQRLVLVGLDGDRGLSVEAEGDGPAGPFRISAHLDPLSNLWNRTEPYGLFLTGSVLGAQVAAAGTVDVPLEAQGVEIGLSASFEDLTALSDWVGGDLFPLTPVKATARLSDAEGALGVTDLDVRIGSKEAAWARVSGSVKDLAKLRDLSLAARFGSADLGFLRTLLGRKLPHIGPVRGSATLTDRDGRLGVELLLTDGQKEVVELQLEGQLDDLLEGAETSFATSLFATDLAAIGDIFDQPLPAIGPAIALGRLATAGGVVGLADLEVTIGEPRATWATVTGQVADVSALHGLHLAGEMFLADTQSLDWALIPSPPNVGPVRASAILSDADGSLGLEGFRIEGLHPALRFDIQGAIDNLSQIDEVDVSATLRTRDLAAIGAAVGTDLPAIGPVEFAGRVVGSDGHVVATDVTARLDKTSFAGEFQASFTPGTRPSLVASIESPLLHLDDVGIEPRRHQPAPSRPARQEPLRWEVLHAIDLDVTLRADRVMGQAGLSIDEFAASIHLENGNLQLRDLEVLFEDGSLTGDARIDARTAASPVLLRTKATGLGLEALVAQVSKARRRRGIDNHPIRTRLRGGDDAHPVLQSVERRRPAGRLLRRRLRDRERRCGRPNPTFGNRRHHHRR
jgi:hypothetical protein